VTPLECAEINGHDHIVTYLSSVLSAKKSSKRADTVVKNDTDGSDCESTANGGVVSLPSQFCSVEGCWQAVNCPLHVVKLADTT